MSIPDPLKIKVLEARDRVAAGHPGYRHRRGQGAMIAAVARIAASEAQSAFACIEGPTGTGKSLGYLIGCVPVALARKHRVVIATATVALQEQLMAKDIPGFLRQAGVEAEVAIAKGRTRYVCPRNLLRLDRSDPNQLGLSLESGTDTDHDASPWDGTPSDADVNTVCAMVRALEEQSWDGDLDAWPSPVPSALRAQVTCPALQCLGIRCPNATACPVNAARARLREAEIVVTNHDLLLTDVVNERASLLPALSDCTLIVDEAHHLAEKALEHFRLEIDFDDDATQLERASRRLLSSSSAYLTAPRVAGAAQVYSEAATVLLRALRALEAALPRVAPDMLYADWPQPEPASLSDAREELAAAADRFRNALDTFQSRLAARQDELSLSKKDTADLDQRIAELQSVADEIHECVALLAADTREGVPVARWYEPLERRVVATPVDVAAALRRALWSRVRGAVLTSATLTSLGRFDRLREQLGLNGLQPEELKLESPFDLERQAELVVPWMDADPRDAEAHTKEVIRRLPGWLDPGTAGALVLFSSSRQMRAVEAAMPAALRSLILMQGTAPRADLLARHARAVEAGQRSILFGLGTFAEGLDLPGPLCETCVIAKLPFAVPDHPIERRRERWLRQQGRSYFFSVALPHAHLKLVQACGRLIRCESDRGRIVVADRRLVTERYGADMLASLPPYRVTIEREPAAVDIRPRNDAQSKPARRSSSRTIKADRRAAPTECAG